MLAHHAVYWLGMGELESMPEHRVVNDVFDQDYVLIGSYFDGILTRELTVTQAYEDLCEMQVFPWGATSPA
jgi:hypothetical protein